MEPEGSVLSLVSPKMLRFRLAALAAVSSLKKKDPAKEAVPAGPTAASTAFARHGSFATTTVPVMSEEAERRAGGCCLVSGWSPCLLCAHLQCRIRRGVRLTGVSCAAFPCLRVCTML